MPILVRGFQSKIALAAYINDVAIHGVGGLPVGRVVAIYYDASSGEHVIVHVAP